MKRIPIKMRLIAAEQELNDFNSLFDLQRRRSVEANKLWQKDTGEKFSPDLGELLRYFMAQRDLLDRFYFMLREGKYGSDEYADLMESYERKDFCRSNTKGEARGAARRKTMSEKQTVEAGNSLHQPLGSPGVEPNVIRATVRDADDELHIECRFSDGQKFAAVRVDSDFPELANRIASFLSSNTSRDARREMEKT